MGLFSSLFGHKKTPEEIKQEKRNALIAAAEQGDISSMLELGELYRNGGQGMPLQESRETGARWFEKAANLGSARAMWLLARMYDPHLMQIVRKDAELALCWYKKACEAGYKDAAAAVGKMLLRGEGAQRDDISARKYFEIGVELGDGEAFVELGRMCENGRGGDKDLDRARRLYERAAEIGSAFAHLYLGDVYYFGKGVAADHRKAALHYTEGKRKNVPAAEAMLCMMMLRGETPLVGTDEEVFRYLLRLSDGFSRDRAGYLIGTCLETGFCVDQDLSKAMKYYEMSAKAGYQPAMIKICTLENKIWQGHEAADEEKIRFWAEKLQQA